MESIRILQIGATSWKPLFELPYYIQLDFWDGVAERPVLEEKESYALVFICRDLNQEECQFVFSSTDAYRVYVLQGIKRGSALQYLCSVMMAQEISPQQVHAFLCQEAKYFYPTPYGEKFNNAQIAVSDRYHGPITWEGKHHLTLTGNFGRSFSQILYWKNTVPVSDQQVLDLWLEYETSGDVEIRLRTTLIPSGSVFGDHSAVQVFNESQMRDIVQVGPGDGERSLFVSIEAKGTGTLCVKALHDRHSRGDHGYFLPGGKRYVTSAREEVFAYFNPGNLKPPLNVYFSGYKTQEGFEGFFLMKSLGHPFLLISESRLIGGGAYFGSGEFEQLIDSIIRVHMQKLNFSHDELILSGLSMGTTAALYYGSRLRPHAIFLGKPLTNWGTIAENERLLRPGGFPSSLEVLRSEENDLRKEDSAHLNKKFWDKVDQGDFTGTKIAVAYMIEDDYDPRSYEDIVQHLGSRGVTITSKGFHGRHNDDTASVVRWFTQQFRKLLRDDFTVHDGRNRTA